MRSGPAPIPTKLLFEYGVIIAEAPAFRCAECGCSWVKGMPQEHHDGCLVQ